MENLDLKTNPNSNLADEPVLVIRHLEDVDDLTSGFDTSIKPLSPESKIILDNDANMIIRNTLDKNLHKILIISSSKNRALMTSDLIKQRIKEIQPDLNVRVKVDGRFSELDHGDVILPDNYKPGRRIDFLKQTWEAFWAETFTEGAEYNNPDYKFGDPIHLGNDKYKYPELLGSFSSFGESYRGLSIRYYEAILEHLEQKERLKESGINTILIAHSATLSILIELQQAAIDISRGSSELKTGDLMKFCWKNYLVRITNSTQDIDFGTVKPFFLGDINDRVVSFLRKEIEYLKNDNHEIK